MKRELTRYGCLLVTCFSIACENWVVIDPPKTELTTDNVFASDHSASSAVAGLYSQLITTNFTLLSSGMTLYPGMSADEIYNSNPGLNDEFVQNRLDPFNTTINTHIWNAAYKYIYHANAILEGLEQSSSISQSMEEKLKGEALFIRSLCYFYLVNLFGDVPFIGSTNYRVNDSEPRMNAVLLYETILRDLSLAEQLLPEVYPTNEKLRANKWVVKAFLARLHLYQGNYEAAIEKSTDLIDSRRFELVDDLNHVFLANSAETIWQLRLDGDSYNTWEGISFIPPEGVMPNFVIYEDLIKSFGVEDKRVGSWVGTVVVNDDTIFFPRKYKVRSGAEKIEYYTVFRLAEQYLIRAEAYAQLGMVELARVDLEMIRKRAGYQSLDEHNEATIHMDLLGRIFHERRLELFCEWGHRWFDLKRTDRLNSVLGEKKPGWRITDGLYPIPELQLMANPALVQNPGY